MSWEFVVGAVVVAAVVYWVWSKRDGPSGPSGTGGGSGGAGGNNQKLK